ncbi:DUF4230 domain-containing protein [Mucilaginibacter limnophilus]|uniref:DUF4230 domain-containing protein n=1 Tax=Mucilaginibacter limnophilus TaxID=1932778 RepID=UPI001F0CBA01|nr:DUF4230 domain-containing protein [Mucilaginibacter limnophilus]
MSSIRSRLSLSLIASLVIVGFLIFMFLYIKREFTNTRTEVSQVVLVQKITSMGKLELVKYAVKDIVEKKEVHTILPDERVLFLAVGEVTACIDLTKVKEQDIIQSKDSVTVTLPQPEICYAKLDHQQSKVYDITGAWFPSNARDMVEEVYKIAEKKILDGSKEMHITDKARENAQLIFKPLLESISGKTVILKFR